MKRFTWNEDTIEHFALLKATEEQIIYLRDLYFFITRDTQPEEEETYQMLSDDLISQVEVFLSDIDNCHLLARDLMEEIDAKYEWNNILSLDEYLLLEGLSDRDKQRIQRMLNTLNF